MKMFADLHTHTIHSHGSGTIDQNVESALKAGLNTVAITDHGLNHVVFGIKKNKIEKMRNEVESAKKKFGINVLLGVEANLISHDGSIDMPKDLAEKFDVILCGYHKAVKPKKFAEIFSFAARNMFKCSKKLKEKNTKAVVSAIENNPIDVWTHVGVGFPVDVVKVGIACRDNGTLLELNGKRNAITKEEMQKLVEEKVLFILSSDAHSPEKIGKSVVGDEIAKRFCIPEELIVNTNEKFVFSKRKK